jgi:hypothetical protein
MASALTVEVPFEKKCRIAWFDGAQADALTLPEIHLNLHW